jgi:site-specific DNA recombinase
MTKSSGHPQNGPKRAVLLARVSSKGQEDNNSLPSQLDAMREYAARLGFAVVEELADTYTGNSAVADRPGGAKVYQHLRKKTADVVILFTIDRTARDDDALEYEIFKRDVKRAGAELHFADIGKVSDDLYGSLAEKLQAMGASAERMKILERTRRGKQKKAADGCFVGGMPVAYGYKYTGKAAGGQFVIDEGEAAVVRRIYWLYTEGEDGQPSMKIKGIAALLTAEGVPPPYGRGRSSGRGWWAFTVRQILSRRNYLGEFPNFKTTLIARDLAIVDEATWQAAQVQRERNKANSRRNQRREYVLSGVISCSCGLRFCGAARRNYRYYCCLGQKVYRHLTDCHEPSVNAAIVEPLVWDWLVRVLSPARLDRGLRRLQKRTAAELQPKRDRLAAVEGLIEKADKKIQKLVSAFADDDAVDEDDENAAVANAVKAEIKTANNRRKAFLAERDRLLAELAQGEISDEAREGIRGRIGEILGAVHRATYADKRFVIEKLDVKAQIRHSPKGCRLQVSCALAPKGVSLPLSNGICSS